MRIANGFSSKIFGVVYVLSLVICLQYMLFVPDLAVNLLFVSKINADLHCTTKFFLVSCHFQKLTSGKTIGSAGLFLFRIEPQLKNGLQSIPRPFFPNSCCVLNSNKKSVFFYVIID